MSLDRELRAVLAERAERCEVPVPDFHALRAGGMARRRRHRRRSVVAAAAAAVVVAVGGLAAWQAQTDPRSDGIANNEDRTETYPGPYVSPPLYWLDLDTGERTPADAFSTDAEYSFSPDGTRVACSGHCFGNTGPLYVADADGSDPVELQVPSGVDNSGKPWDAEPVGVKWSPDGTTLLYTLTTGGPGGSNIQDLVLHDIASDETGPLVDFGLQDTSFYGLGGFDFSPDGGSVLYSRPRQPAPCGEPDPVAPCSERTDFDLWSVPISGGDPTLVLRDAGVPGYLADGHRIAFVEVGTHAWNGGSLSIAANGVRRTLFEPLGVVWEMSMSPDRSQILVLSGAGIAVVDVATGETSRVYGNSAAWAGDDRLLMGCVPQAPSPDEEPTVDTCS
jgi:hypothetical protein